MNNMFVLVLEEGTVARLCYFFWRTLILLVLHTGVGAAPVTYQVRCQLCEMNISRGNSRRHIMWLQEGEYLSLHQVASSLSSLRGKSLALHCKLQTKFCPLCAVLLIMFQCHNHQLPSGYVL